VYNGESRRIVGGRQQPIKHLDRRLQPVLAEALMRAVIVVVVEELVQRVEPPAVLLVGLEEPFDLPARLRSPEDTDESAGTIRETDVVPERPYLVRVLLKNGRFERFHAHYYPVESNTEAIEFGIYRVETTANLFVDFRSLSWLIDTDQKTIDCIQYTSLE
jgi:hypothetical protein